MRHYNGFGSIVVFYCEIRTRLVLFPIKTEVTISYPGDFISFSTCHLFSIFCSEGCLISEDILNLVPKIQKVCEINVRQLFTLGWKVISHNFLRVGLN